MPTTRKLLPARKPQFQRHAMVQFIGVEAANVATNWFFGVTLVEAQASAAGTSIATAFQFEVGEGAAAGAGATTATATRILGAAASAEGSSAAGGTAIRWSQVASGTAATWGQIYATAIRQPHAAGAIAGRAITTSATGIRQRIAVGTAAGSAGVLCNPWIAAVGTITASGTASGAATRLRNAAGTGAGCTPTNAATGIRVVLLTAETLVGSTAARVDIWVYADGTASGEVAVAAQPTGIWRAAATGLGAGAISGTSTRILTASGAPAGAATATLDPTIRVQGAAAGTTTGAGSAIRQARATATSPGQATQSAVGRRIRYGSALASGAVLIGATGSWVKSAYGYAEGRGDAVAGTPDWRQTARAISGCGSVLTTVEELTGLIVATAAEVAGYCLQVHAIPDATIVLVDAAEPAQADRSATATAAPDLILWSEPLVCGQQALATAVPETVLDAQIVLVERPSLLAGDAQYAITMAKASSSGWSLALGASYPIGRWAQAEAGGAAVAEYQEPPVVVESALIDGFADVVAYACSSEWGEARSWAWSGTEAVIAA